MSRPVCRHLGVDASDALALEDSFVGATSALAASLTCYLVTPAGARCVLWGMRRRWNPPPCGASQSMIPLVWHRVLMKLGARDRTQAVVAVHA